MVTHSSILAWRTPGTGEPGGLPSLGSHRVGRDWSDLAAVAAAAASKYTIKKVRNQSIEWEKIFANHISDKGFIFRIYFFRKSCNSTIKMQITQLKNEERIWTFLQRRVPINTWKDAQHHESLKKWKLKPQWDATTHILESLKRTSLFIPRILVGQNMNFHAQAHFVLLPFTALWRYCFSQT